MELAGRMSIHVTIEASYPKGRLGGFAIVGGVKFFLRQRSQQQPHAFELDWRRDFFKELAEVVNAHYLAARDIAQFRPILKENRGWKLRQKRLWQIKFDVKSC